MRQQAVLQHGHNGVGGFAVLVQQGLQRIGSMGVFVGRTGRGIANVFQP